MSFGGYKTREEYAAYMRGYRRRKKAERLSHDSVVAQCIADFHSLMLNAESEAGKKRIEELLASKPEFVPSGVRELADELERYFPLEAVKYRVLLETVAFNVFMVNSVAGDEDRVLLGEGAQRRFVVEELAGVRRLVVEAAAVLESLTVWECDKDKVPLKGELYPKGQVKRFLEYMPVLKDHGFSFYVAREACGERFVDHFRFWSPEWMRAHPSEVFGRSFYEMGSRFYGLASAGGYSTEFVDGWRDCELVETEHVEELNRYYARYPYEVESSMAAFEAAVNPFLDEDVAFNKVLDYLRKAGKLDVLDVVRFHSPSFLKRKFEEFKEKHTKFMVMDIDGIIIECLKRHAEEAEIIGKVRAKYVVHLDELRDRIVELEAFLKELSVKNIPEFKRLSNIRFMRGYQQKFLTEARHYNVKRVKVKLAGAVDVKFSKKKVFE